MCSNRLRSASLGKAIVESGGPRVSILDQHEESRWRTLRRYE